jgi:hypothetical protein
VQAKQFGNDNGLGNCRALPSRDSRAFAGQSFGDWEIRDLHRSRFFGRGSLPGTVNFYLDGGSNPVASVSLSGGKAQYATSSLSAGTHSLAAALVSTNANFNGSTSTSLTEAITNFSFSASPTSDTVARGSTGTYTLTLTPIGGLTGSVSLSYSGAPVNTTCSISPPQVTLDGTNSAQATVARNASKGTHTLTLKGTSGSVIHSTTVTRTIK